MGQTSEGAKKAYQNRIARLGIDSVRNMQSRGGKASTPGGFGTDKVGEDGLTGKERARIASAKAHKIRNHNYNKDYEDYLEA